MHPYPSSKTSEAEGLKLLPKAEVHLHLEGCFEATVIGQWTP